MSDIKKIHDILDSIQDDVILINDKIWEAAETYFEEYESAKILETYLEKEGFTIESGVSDIPTAFVAKWENGGHKVGFLGEYDALEGVMQEKGSFDKKTPTTGNTKCGHGCGHNSLGAGAYGAAVALKKYAQENDMAVSVYYYGCPGEENGSGKVFMARSGLFDELDICLTWHPGDDNAVMGTGTLANLSINFEFTGLTSHAAASPHLGRSALDAAELMNVGVNYLREHIIPTARIHYSYIDAGTKAPNVVQDYAHSYYFVRAPKVSQMFEIADRVYDIAKGAALMTGTSVKITIADGLSDYVPNAVLSNLMQETFQELGAVDYTDSDILLAKNYLKHIPEAQIKEAQKVVALNNNKPAFAYDDIYLDNAVAPYKHNPDVALPGSTDVGDVSYCVPTAQCNVTCYAIGTPGHSWQLTGQSASVLAHKGTVHAAKVMALTAIKAIKNPQIILDAKKEYKQSVPNGYTCPTPNDILPIIPEKK